MLSLSVMPLRGRLSIIDSGVGVQTLEVDLEGYNLQFLLMSII